MPRSGADTPGTPLPASPMLQAAPTAPLVVHVVAPVPALDAILARRAGAQQQPVPAERTGGQLTTQQIEDNLVQSGWVRMTSRRTGMHDFWHPLSRQTWAEWL